ncbi:MAG: DUF4445 domain-containing protein [Anaerolineaceae bacterium]|nr:DUF4445 domain-containing protein [Anaerolineaceae bacterium]
MPSGLRGTVPDGTLLLDAVRQLGVELESICNGQGTCHKCRVRIETGDFPKHGIASSPGHLSPLTLHEQQVFGDESDGHRLACHARVEGDLLVYIPETSLAHKQIIRKSANTRRRIAVNPAVRPLFVTVKPATLEAHPGDWERLQAALAEQHQLTGLHIDLSALRRLQGALRAGDWQVTVIIRENRDVLDVRSGFREAVYGLAVDIGTTTIVAHLCDLRTGAVLDTQAAMNPQVAFGEDVMSRISYVMMQADGLDTLHRAVIETLNTLAADATQVAGVMMDDIYDVVVVGNTTMTHLFLGISPLEIGRAPFALVQRDAVDARVRDLNLKFNPAAAVHVLPSLGGHVGADTLAALLAETPYTGEDISLVVDVGTNAEVVIGNRHWMVAASSPTGPAFEGAQITHGMRAAPSAIENVRIDPQTGKPRFRVIGVESWSDTWDTPPDLLPIGICGSGIIDVVAELFLAGILLPDGGFNPSSSCDWLQWHDDVGSYVLADTGQTATGHPIVITQRDVRNIQLAKGALYAGIKLLMQQTNIDHVDRIVLAGAFGSHIDIERAMILGLIPDCDLKRVYAVGNAAGDGARIALLNVEKRQEARQVVEHITYVELAANDDFQEAFVEALHLPHAVDSFPHLAHVLPVPSTAVSPAATPRRTHARRARKSVDFM